MSETKHLHNQVKPIPPGERARLLGQQGCVVWFTGLSGSGKSTIARACEEALLKDRRFAYVLDGDEIRTGLNKDLGFSMDDRTENLRRIAEVARLFAECGVICITSFISPLKSSREEARQVAGDARFFEVFIDAPLDVCEQRDPKGLYRKVRAGEIPEFTGIGSSYEPPVNPDLHIRTDKTSIQDAVAGVLQTIRARGFLKANA